MEKHFTTLLFLTFLLNTKAKEIIDDISNLLSEEYVDMSATGCGQVKVKDTKQSRIVNGQDCAFGEYPWQVAILEFDRPTKRIVSCGGSLISEQWIVTAAHCLDEGLNRTNFVEANFARLGEHDLLSLDEPLPHIDRNFSKVVIHPLFDNVEYYYDIMLVKLETSIMFQKNIQPICLYNQNKLLIGKFLTATGWGAIFEDGISSAILQSVALPVIKNKECEKMFIESGNLTPIGNVFICAGYKYGKFDTCQGDSGGPLQMRMKNGRWALVGIVSWGFGCGRFLQPGLFTRVSLTTHWIKRTLKKEKSRGKVKSR